MPSAARLAATWFMGLIAAFMTVPLAVSAQPLVLDPDVGAYEVVDHGQLYRKDHDGFSDELTIADFLPDAEELVMLEETGAFAPITTRQIGIGFDWTIPVVRVHVANPLPTEQEWVLAFNRASDYVYKVYFVEDGAPLPEEPVFYFDDDSTSWDRADDVWIYTTVTLPPDSSGRIFASFLNITGGAAMTLETPAHYAAKRERHNLHFFTIVGLTLGLTIITASLMLTLRRFVAFYYLGAVLSGLLLVMLSEQQFEALFPSLAQFSFDFALITYAAAAGPVFALLFQRQFFADVGGTGKVFGNVLLAAAMLCVVSLVGSIEFAVLPVEGFLLSVTLCVLLISANGVLAIIKGFVGRWPFFLASTVYAFSLAVMVATYAFSQVIAVQEAGLLLLYAIVFESLCMALTMFAQVRWMRSEKETALKAQLQAAEDRLAMQKALSHAAHDIRQPLASLRMAMQSAREKGNTPDNFAEAIDYLEDIVQRQLAVNAPAAEDPTTTEATSQFEANLLLSNIQTMFAEEAAAKGIALSIVRCSRTVSADIFAVMRIVSNLVANAVRNTDAGKVLVGCRRKAGQLVFEVIDTGPGFAPDQLDTLRQPHARAGNYQGNGLGLGIVHDLVAAHGLGLDVASEPSKGTRFSLSVPTA